MTDLQKEKIRRLRMQGMSYVKIGEILGVPDNTVRSFCRRCGLGEEAKNTCCCKQCGKPFTAYGNKGRKYCCHQCYIVDRFGGDRHE